MEERNGKRKNPAYVECREQDQFIVHVIRISLYVVLLVCLSVGGSAQSLLAYRCQTSGGNFRNHRRRYGRYHVETPG